MTESQLAESVAQYLALALPPNALAFHVPNEGKRGWQAQRAFTNGGGVAGIPDWCILWAGRCLFVELKIGRKHPTATQEAIHQRIILAGHVVTVCRSLEEVVAFLTICGVPPRKSVTLIGKNIPPVRAFKTRAA